MATRTWPRPWCARQLPGGQPAISPWAFVPHELIHPFVPLWRRNRTNVCKNDVETSVRGGT